MKENPQAVPTDFEREKWRTEVGLRQQELSIKEREQSRLAAEAGRARWWNPLFIAIVGATIAALSSIAVSWWNGKASQQTELLRAESARILEMIKTGDVEKAKGNLRFLLDTGLVTDPTATSLRGYLDRQQPGQGPVLPSMLQPAGPNVEASVITQFTCPGENGQKQYWIYHYTARQPGAPQFRVVLPPDWGHAIGGRDLFSQQEADKVASEACSSKG